MHVKRISLFPQDKPLAGKSLRSGIITPIIFIIYRRRIIRMCMYIFYAEHPPILPSSIGMLTNVLVCRLDRTTPGMF